MNGCILMLAAAGLLFGWTPAYAAETAPGLLGGLWLWVLEGQREMTNAMTAAVRQLKDGDVVASGLVLALISFLYGI